MNHEKVAFLTALPLVRRPAPWGNFLQRRLWPRPSCALAPRHFARACQDGAAPPSKKPRGNTLLLVGLGNPGSKFRGTRHNVGFEVAELFVRRHGGAFSARRELKADVAEVRVGGCTVHVVKPRTYMNLSGSAVKAAMRETRVPREALMVVSDDMALEIGRMRLRARGSAGGHNGLKSVEGAVGSREYCRLKVGVGECGAGAEGWKEHVLGRFSRMEEKILEGVMMDGVEILDFWAEEAEIGKVINRMGVLQQSRR